MTKVYNDNMNNLLETRNKYHITQQEAADALGISLRTYQRYEKNFDIASKKTQNLIKILDDSYAINETKGILSIERIKQIIVPILEKNQINKCYLFGSYVRNEAREDSDVDLLVDTDMTGLDFFALVEELRVALHKKVDLLRLKDISDNNPISLIILKEGVLIYGNN